MVSRFWPLHQSLAYIPEVCCFISCPTSQALSDSQVKYLQTVTAGAFHLIVPYQMASGLGSVRLAEDIELDLLQSAVATAFSNSAFFSQTPRRPVIFHTQYTKFDDAHKAASKRSAVTHSRLLGSKPTEREIKEMMELFGLLPKPRGGFTFKEGLLVPGTDGKIVGTQGPRGTIIYTQDTSRPGS